MADLENLDQAGRSSGPEPARPHYRPAGPKFSSSSPIPPTDAKHAVGMDPSTHRHAQQRCSGSESLATPRVSNSSNNWPPIWRRRTRTIRSIELREVPPDVRGLRAEPAGAERRLREDPGEMAGRSGGLRQRQSDRAPTPRKPCCNWACRTNSPARPTRPRNGIRSWRKEFPNTPQAKKASGVLRRLELDRAAVAIPGEGHQGPADRLSPPTYRGKVVLIQFWSTIDDRCKDDMDALKDLYAKYGGRGGFEIIGVCLDQRSEGDASLPRTEPLSVAAGAGARRIRRRNWPTSWA